MKNIFITVGERSVLRNILHTSFFNTLKSALSGIQIVLVVAPALEEECRKEFETHDVRIEVLARTPISSFERLCASMARNGLYTGTNDVMQRRAWYAGEGRVPPVVKRVFGKTIGRATRGLVRRLELMIPPHQSIERLFLRYQPSMFFSTVITNPTTDIPLLREAKRRRIPVAGMVRSWDNLTSAGYLRFLPDIYFAQNEYLSQTAERLHGFPRTHTRVVGLPHYDWYKDSSLIVSREEFCKTAGLDPRKALLMYGAIGEFLFPREAQMAEVLERLIAAGSIQTPVQALFRPHPAFPMSLESMRSLQHVVAETGDLSSLSHLINTLYHADVIITAGSTLMIDAPCFDKPVVTVAFDGLEKEANDWFSTARFYDHFTHIQVLIEKTKGVRITRSPAELATEINAYLTNPTRDKKERARIVSLFASPYDGHAGERLAEGIVDFLSNI